LGVKDESDPLVKKKVHETISDMLRRGEQLSEYFEKCKEQPSGAVQSTSEQSKIAMPTGTSIMTSSPPLLPRMDVQPPRIDTAVVTEGSAKFPVVYAITNGMRTALTASTASASPSVRYRFDRQPAAGSIKSSWNFEFTEYCPAAFKQLRETLGITNQIYMKSMTHTLCEMGSAGKSGSIFYKTMDSRYIIKSMKEDEGHFLLSILLDYFLFMQQNPNSMLTRYLGLYALKLEGETADTNPQVIHFVVMDNVLPNENIVPIHAKYDLKGSSVDRAASKAEKAKGPNAILKDIDMLQRGLYLGPHKRKLLFDQLFLDCQFLQERGIMDYSFFIGIHEFGSGTTPGGSSDRSVFKSEHYGGWFSTAKDNSHRNEVYYFGIIDMLQPYNLRKQLETSVKSLYENPEEISCVEPVKYSFRFQSYLKKITNMFTLL
jgi:1-phosphatidylinositol-4-phosphate 5-kinase